MWSLQILDSIAMWVEVLLFFAFYYFLNVCTIYYLLWNSITISAPGKALIAGGYLVLEKPNIGIIVSSSSRFYSTIKLLVGQCLLVLYRNHVLFYLSISYEPNNIKFISIRLNSTVDIASKYIHYTNSLWFY